MVNVLILEDDPIISFDIKNIVESLLRFHGHIASTMPSALKIAHKHHLTTGTHYSDATALKTKWKRVITRSKVRYRKLYNARHTFATAMLRSGKVSVLTVAKMLGHTNSKMVLTTYSGFIEAEELKIDRGISLFSEGTKEGTFRKMA